MRFIVDECTGPAVGRWLDDQGFQVFSVYDESRGMSDDEILDKAYSQEWVLITNDKDFGDKIFRDRQPHHGVVLLRLQDERGAAKISVLRKLLVAHADQLADSFTVVTETQVRFG